MCWQINIQKNVSFFGIIIKMDLYWYLNYTETGMRIVILPNAIAISVMLLPAPPLSSLPESTYHVSIV